MLRENDIVEKLAEFLQNNGYEIEQKLTTNQTGIDIIAENDFGKIYIEAKGETSASKTSKRYGLPFNRNQVKSHISVALLATMNVISSKPSGINTPTFYMFNGQFKAITLKQFGDFIDGKYEYPDLFIVDGEGDDETLMMVKHPYFRKPLIMTDDPSND